MGDGLPAVVLGPDGRPGITIPAAAPPKQLVVADLKKGSGPVLKKGDTAVVHYTGVLWDADKTVFDSTWQNGAPTSLPLKTGSGGVVKGFVSALAGSGSAPRCSRCCRRRRRTGRREAARCRRNATLVFVVDILGKV